MYENNDDDDLFLSDIGSLSQIYDKKPRFVKNFNLNYKKRGSGKSNPYLGGDKRPKPPPRFDKHFDRNPVKSKEEKGHSSHTKFSDNFQGDKSTVNLYEDEDIQVVSHTKNTPKEDTFMEGMYDEFELNVNSNSQSPKPAPLDPLTKTKNDAPWIQNRESRRENDAKRLLEFERSLKQDELLGKDRFQNPEFFEQQKQFPVNRVESQAKSVRSFQREQMKFNENYSKWAYDDAYDNEDKSSDEKDSAVYDPEQYDDNNPDTFNRERYANPEPQNISNNELLDENYPNAAEMPPYRVGKLKVEHKLEEKLRKENSLKLLRQPNQKSNAVDEGLDEDVIILDDNLINANSRVQNEVNKKIKISFTTDHKPKSIINESIFPDESASPEILVESSTPSPKPGQKIPVLSRKEPPPIVVTTKPSKQPFLFSTPVTTVPVKTMPPPRPLFSNTAYPMVNQNFMNYNAFGAPVMNEMPPGNAFIPSHDNEFFNNPPPPGTFSTPQGWIPASVNHPSAPSAFPANENVGVKEPQKLEKPVNEAVKEEIRQHNKELMNRLDEYYQRYNALNTELNKLKKQKKSLADKKSPEAEEFLKENDKLQSAIQNKIKAVKNVIDMFSKIVKDDAMPKGADSADESSKRSSKDSDDSSSKDSHKKFKRKRSRSKSRHRSRTRSRSRGRRTRSRSRHRSRTRSRSRSRSPRRRHWRSRSRDKYHRKRRSRSRDRKPKPKRPDKDEPAVPKEPEAQPVPVPVPVVENTPKEPVKVLHDKFKPSFEEVIRPVEAPKPKVVENGKPQSRFSDKPVIDLPINAVPQVPATLVEKIRDIAPPLSKGYVPDGLRNEQINYVYYDPEIHWCRVCNVFPKTAKEYLLHLHAAEHKQTLTKNNLVDYPWHDHQPDNRKPVYPNAPTERIPIRGLPFFVSATAWYCKLCKEWMGDLHCASAHLKSDAHEVNYLTFLESNPKWDEYWLESRNKAFEAMNKLKAAESITPAYSSETYVKPSPVPPPPPPLQMREKKKKSKDTSEDSSTSSSSSSSSDESDKRKKKKKDRRKERKRSPEERPRQLVTDAKKAREMAKKVAPKPDQVEKFEAIKEKNEDDDKFVQEWMNPVRDKSKEQEFMELKNKLKKKEVVEKNKIVFETKKKPPTSYRRHDDDRTRHDRDDGRQRYDDERRRFDDPRSRRSDDDKFKRPRVEDSRSRSSFSFNRSVAERESSKSSDDNDGAKKSNDGGARKPPDRGGRRFPFIGKMPSKSTRKPESAETKTKTGKPSDATKEQKPAADLPPAIKKTIEEYDKANDVDIDVVDMDINDDEDEPVSIVIDDNISRKKDFDETLKLLYPEEKTPQAKAAEQSSQAQRENVNAAAAVVAAGLPPNITQDYLVSLIESTLLEKLKFKIPGLENQSSQIMELASSMKQALFSNPNLAPVITSSLPPQVLGDIPIPMEDTTTVHITAEEQLYNVPLPPEPQAPGVELDDQMDELAPPGTTDDMVVKKKKNPISQKKRRHLRKIREKLEEQEKLLQEKIEERKNLGEGTTEAATDEATADEARGAESPSPPRPVNIMDSDLMMLGIDEDDSAALCF